MALGKRKRQQQDTFWVAADKLGGGPRNAFYDRINQRLNEIDFDGKLEKVVEPFYQKTGRKGPFRQAFASTSRSRATAVNDNPCSTIFLTAANLNSRL
jgi:hypothetical protein